MNTTDNVGKRIRRMLLNLDLRLVYARGALKQATHEYNAHSKNQSKYHKQKALTAKIEKESYKSYIKNLETTKQEILNDLEKVLNRYTPRFKVIWSMFYIQEYTLEEISEKMNLSLEQVKKIITKLQKDLEVNYRKEEL